MPRSIWLGSALLPALAAFAVHVLAAQVHQDVRDVDLHRAGVVAGAAQGRGVGQGVVLLRRDPGQQRGQDRADRSRVGGSVGVPAGAFVDGADVHAGAAADAVQRGAAHLVGQGGAASVVQQDQVDVLRPVVGRDAGPQRGVRVHPLAGGGPREQLHEHFEVLPARQQLLDAHDGDERFRQRQAHAPVAFGFDDGEGPGVGEGEVRAGHGHLGAEELAAQVCPGGRGEAGRLVGQLRIHALHFAQEDVPDLAAVLVDGRDQDVAGLVVVQLDDQLGEVGLVTPRCPVLRGIR